MFTGKPQIGGLGHAFLFRNYRPNLGKWQTADPLGYPDGWNNLAYCNNKVIDCFDWQGGETTTITRTLLSSTTYFYTQPSETIINAQLQALLNDPALPGLAAALYADYSDKNIISKGYDACYGLSYDSQLGRWHLECYISGYVVYE